MSRTNNHFCGLHMLVVLAEQCNAGLAEWEKVTLGTSSQGRVQPLSLVSLLAAVRVEHFVWFELPAKLCRSVFKDRLSFFSKLLRLVIMCRSGTRNHCYANSLKLDAVGFAAEHSVAATARKFNVATKSIREWKKIEASVRKSQRKFRSSGGGRKAKFAVLEERLFGRNGRRSLWFKPEASAEST